MALLAAIALSCWASARFFDPTGGIDALLVTAALTAAGCCTRAALALVQLELGKTKRWVVSAWLGGAAVSLFLLVTVSGLSRGTG